MAYWGSAPPIIKYGSSYQNTWDLSGYDCYYKYSWLKERELHTSVLTGRITPYDKAPSAIYGRLTAEITIFNLKTQAEVDLLRALRGYPTLQLVMHADAEAANLWTVTFVVEQFQPFASGESGLPYPEFDSGYLKLTSQDYIDLKGYDGITQ